METVYDEGWLMRAPAAILFLVLLNSPGIHAGEHDHYLQRMEQNFAWIQDMSAILTITVDMDRLNVPPMTGKFYFKRPDKLHVASDGFMILPREGLGISLFSFSDTYIVDDARSDTLDGEFALRLMLRTKNDGKGIRPFAVYIDTIRWVVDGFVRSMPEGRTLTGVFGYERTSEGFVPNILTATISTIGEEPPDDESQIETDLPRRRMRLPRSGTIVIRYDAIETNIGIPDAVFEKKKEE